MTAGNVFYVSVSGTDAGDGSSTTPWRSLSHAAASVRPGDTVVVKSGLYTGFELRTDGTADARITFRGEPGAIINAGNARTGDGINLEGADYVTIEGFQVNGTARAGIRSVLNTGVVIRNNQTDRNGRWGIFTGWSEDVLIENNVTTRSVTEHGIYVSNSADRPVVRGNTVWGNRASGIQLNADGNLSGDGVITEALIENNVVYENGTGGGAAINLDGVQNSRVQNNLLYDNHASGIVLYRFNGDAGSSGNVVVNNTVVQAADARWAVYIANGSTGNTLYNNILYNPSATRGSITVSSDSLAGLVSDYNVLIDRMSVNGDSSRITLADWRLTTGQDTHSLIATPAQLFVNAAGDDYRLAPSGPAVDAGTAALAPSVDRKQTPRPSGAGWDIGAYESAPADATAPAVRVTGPNGGETLTAGSARAITWTATDAVGVTSVDLYYSADGGMTYALIAAGRPNTGSYAWTVPTAPTANGRVRVVARDAAGNVGVDASDASFTVASSAAVASDGFETGTLSGGSGWVEPAWTGTKVYVRSDAGPAEGAYHARLRGGSRLQRSVSLAGQTGATLRFGAKVAGFEGADAARVLVSTDGVNWTVAQTLTAADSDGLYRDRQVDLSDYSGVARLHVAFEVAADHWDDTLYLDRVRVESAPADATAPESVFIHDDGELLLLSAG